MQLTEIWVVWDTDRDEPVISMDAIDDDIDSYLFCLTEDVCLEACQSHIEEFGMSCEPRRFTLKRDDNSGSLADCNEERPVR